MSVETCGNTAPCQWNHFGEAVSVVPRRWSRVDGVTLQKTRYGGCCLCFEGHARRLTQTRSAQELLAPRFCYAVGSLDCFASGGIVENPCSRIQFAAARKVERTCAHPPQPTNAHTQCPAEGEEALRDAAKGMRRCTALLKDTTCACTCVYACTCETVRCAYRYKTEVSCAEARSR